MKLKHIFLVPAVLLTAATDSLAQDYNLTKPFDTVLEEADINSETQKQEKNENFKPELLFREDFGGNSKRDPIYVDYDVLEGVTTLRSQPNFPLATNSFRNYHSYEDGCYDVRKNGFPRGDGHGHPYDSWYLNFDDHTSPNNPDKGYIMQVDMGDKPAVFYKMQIDGLISNTLLYLSMWGHPVAKGSDTHLKLIVEDTKGQTLATKDVVISSGINDWQQVGIYFPVPKGETSVVYKIYSEGGNSGNDFALDDIEVYLNTPPTKVYKYKVIKIGRFRIVISKD